MKEYQQAIEKTLHRGVVMRFLLFDTGDERTCGVLASSLNQECKALQNKLEDSLKRLREIYKDEPKGRLEVKLYKP